MIKYFAMAVTTGDFELKLELKPEHYKRYLKVRKHAEERINRMLRNREVYEDRLRVEDDRQRGTEKHKKTNKKRLVRS